MQKINSLPFAQLKNAEHVSFFTNVQVARGSEGQVPDPVVELFIYDSYQVDQIL